MTITPREGVRRIDASKRGITVTKEIGDRIRANKLSNSEWTDTSIDLGGGMQFIPLNDEVADHLDEMRYAGETDNALLTRLLDNWTKDKTPLN